MERGVNTIVNIRTIPVKNDGSLWSVSILKMTISRTAEIIMLRINGIYSKMPVRKKTHEIRNVHAGEDDEEVNPCSVIPQTLCR